jgi:hypothetical protein
LPPAGRHQRSIPGHRGRTGRGNPAAHPRGRRKPPGNRPMPMSGHSAGQPDRGDRAVCALNSDRSTWICSPTRVVAETLWLRRRNVLYARQNGRHCPPTRGVTRVIITLPLMLICLGCAATSRGKTTNTTEPGPYSPSARRTGFLGTRAPPSPYQSSQARAPATSACPQERHGSSVGRSGYLADGRRRLGTSPLSHVR